VTERGASPQTDPAISVEIPNMETGRKHPTVLHWHGSIRYLAVFTIPWSILYGTLDLGYWVEDFPKPVTSWCNDAIADRVQYVVDSGSPFGGLVDKNG
jgi:hypothetical protein